MRERVCLANSAGVELTCGTSAEQVRQFTYWGATGLPLTETLTDGAGTQALTTTYAYDPAGRLLSQDGPLPGSDDASYFRYDGFGRRTWEIGPIGANGLRNARRFTYRNSDDRVTAVEEGTLPNHTSSTLTVHRRTDTSYDARRNPAVEAVASGGTTYALVQRTFDLSNRLECEARRMNPAVFGSLPASACTLGPQGTGANDFGPDRITRNVWDAAGQLLQVQRAWGVTTANGFPQTLQQNYATYTYSANGLRRTVTDANGNRAELRYNGHDRLVRWVFPSRTTPGALNEADYEAYTYDAVGNRLTLRKRDGKTITFLYDNLNRVTRKTVPVSASGAAGYSVFYGYDIGNRQTFARFGSASPSQPGITSTYDSLGRLVSSANSMGGTTRTLTYQVDAGGRRTRLTFPDGQYFTYEHSPAGELTAIRENGTTQVATFSYDAVSRPSAQAFPGASAAFQYDPISRPSNLNHDLAGTAADNAATFAYNPASQIVTRTLSNDAYAATAPAATSRSYAVNGLNQYTAVAGTAIGYDNNGNLSSDPGSASGTGGATGYVYDSENRLVSASGGTSATLIYDPMGRLFQTVGGGVTTRFLYDGDELVAEYDGAGTLLRRYVHGLGTDDPVLWYEGAAVTAATRRSLHRNHQGSIVAVADNNGAAAAINGYDSWGLHNPGWTVATNGRFGFTGQIWLPELGLWHYKARLYSPTLGRFMQTDPVGYDDHVNLYAYVGNDPVNGTDPTGLAAEITCGSRITISAGCSGATLLDLINMEEKEPPRSRARQVGGGGNDIHDTAYDSGGGNDPRGIGDNRGPPLDDGSGGRTIRGIVRGILGRLSAVVLFFTHAEASAPAPGRGPRAAPSFPQNRGQTGHIFRNAPGHYPADTPANRAALVNTARFGQPVRTDNYGTRLYRRINPDGTETWVQVRNGVIQNGGINQVPRY